MFEGIIQQEQNRKGSASASDNDYKHKKLSMLAGLLGTKPPKEKNWNDPNVQKAARNRRIHAGY